MERGQQHRVWGQKACIHVSAVPLTVCVRHWAGKPLCFTLLLSLTGTIKICLTHKVVLSIKINTHKALESPLYVIFFMMNEESTHTHGQSPSVGHLLQLITQYSSPGCGQGKQKARLFWVSVKVKTPLSSWAPAAVRSQKGKKEKPF